MIIGLGTDIVSIERIKAVLEKNGGAFIERVCTKAEKQYLQSGTETAVKLAKLWAVKEAAAKALGTGFSGGITLRDIELSHDASGRPHLTFSGQAQARLLSLTRDTQSNIQVSLSDDRPWAHAVVIIEKI
ncbi:MAG: holo-ACP synthase [Alphaproteobacteria bacterium]|nr:holo-ACP synthase [Alphaproteobacteria bacterium]